MRIFFILAFCCLSTSVLAETVTIEASQDNTLYESSQGPLSNGAGGALYTGMTASNGRRRAVVAFKDLAALPAGAQIQSVKFHIRVNKASSPETLTRLHRLQADWGEAGSNAPGQGGGGTGAEPGDATWNHRFFDNLTWNSPGGDFAATASAETTLNLAADYTFGSTAAMIADVQAWIDNPSSNFGWILIAGENTQSARRILSRESSFAQWRPRIEVEYTSSGSSGPTPGSDFSGPWFDPTQDGEGFLIYKTAAGWLIYYFGYSVDMERLWLVSNLLKIENLQFGQEYELSLLVGEPGSFGMATPSSELTAWGTLRILFIDCATGVFTLDGIDGRKVYDAQKLIGVEGASCEATE
jgi:hypothetical protein